MEWGSSEPPPSTPSSARSREARLEERTSFRPEPQVIRFSLDAASGNKQTTIQRVRAKYNCSRMNAPQHEYLDLSFCGNSGALAAIGPLPRAVAVANLGSGAQQEGESQARKNDKEQYLHCARTPLGSVPTKKLQSPNLVPAVCFN